MWIIMLDYNDEILLEQYITYENVSKDERDKCVNLLLHTKEMEESCINNGKCNYDIVSLNLNRKNNYICFNGSTTNDKENRMIDGYIYKSGNKYFVVNNIYRLYEYLDDEDRIIKCIDLFTFKNNKVYRNTSYANSLAYFEKEFDEFDNDSLYKYYYDMIYPNEKTLKNTKK